MSFFPTESALQYVLGRRKHVSKHYGNMLNSPFGKGKQKKHVSSSEENINNSQGLPRNRVNEQSFGYF